MATCVYQHVGELKSHYTLKVFFSVFMSFNFQLAAFLRFSKKIVDLGR